MLARLGLRPEAEEDLARLLMALLREDARLEQRATMRLLNAIRQWTEVYFTRNNSERSRRNAAQHYDIGNDFYRLWLDKEMQYTCAYFPDDDLTIEAAQQAKMDHVCRKLQLRPGDRVAEAGCGWGGLARHMALNYGAKVSSWNVSAEQVQYARDRAKAEGYDDRVTYVLDDYRNITGE